MDTVEPVGMSPLAVPRARLTSAGMYMRYDYAWKEAEFKQAETRMTGIGCRLLYLFEVWRDSAESNKKDAKIELIADDPGEPVAPVRPKVLIQANGFGDFSEQLSRACSLMEFDVLPAETPSISEQAQVQIVFIYISPHGEERVENQYAVFEAITAYHDQAQTSPESRPLFCFLLGEAGFLSPPATDEVERLRGLSGFAISQRLTPLLKAARYTSVAHFSIEFTAETSTHSDEEEKRNHLSSLMDQFACMDHNLMHQAEKWEVYAADGSSFVQDVHDDEGLISHASESEVRYWLELTHGKTCNQCHETHDKLLRCSRCGNAFYCSRECQKAAWKLHKRLCGKKSDEVN